MIIGLNRHPQATSRRTGQGRFAGCLPVPRGREAATEMRVVTTLPTPIQLPDQHERSTSPRGGSFAVRLAILASALHLLSGCASPSPRVGTDRTSTWDYVAEPVTPSADALDGRLAQTASGSTDNANRWGRPDGYQRGRQPTAEGGASRASRRDRSQGGRRWTD